uniref:Uncharacterized protein n=1 Tax=Panagrolaimus sp. ES5 TaxID=591445 RepID=A0AC34FZ57_9BILA
MIPDFPMPPGLHGIFDSVENESDETYSTKKQPKIYHSFENFEIPDDEFDDRGFNDPLPYSPIIKQVQHFSDLENLISPELPSPSSPNTPAFPGPITQISHSSNLFSDEEYLFAFS